MPRGLQSFLIRQVNESTRSLTPIELISSLGIHHGTTRRDAKRCLGICVNENHLIYRQVLGRTVVVPSLNRYHDLAPGVVLAPAHLSPIQGPTHCITMKEGISFGNGTHPTTKLCAELMVMVKNIGSRWNHSLDLGTGTGVLSLLAVKLGVCHVDATEIDPIALHDAWENACLNGFSSRIAFHHADGFVSNKRYQLVTANLRSPTLISLHGTIAAWMDFQGDLILSGIREGEEERLISIYAPSFDLKYEKRSKGWVGLHFRRKES